MKLKQMMFIKIFMKTKICLILLTIHKIKVFYPVNEKVISSMKDEFKGKIISEFVVLRSEMYSLIAVDGEEIIKAKGRNKNIVKS